MLFAATPSAPLLLLMIWPFGSWRRKPPLYTVVAYTSDLKEVHMADAGPFSSWDEARDRLMAGWPDAQTVTVRLEGAGEAISDRLNKFPLFYSGAANAWILPVVQGREREVRRALKAFFAYWDKQSSATGFGDS